MVAAAEVHQPWWMDERKLLMRRLSRLNFGRGRTELTEGLPDGVTVRRESTKTANDMLVIYIDGESVERISNMKGDAAAPVAQWIELYRREMDMVDVTEQGLALLKELAAKGGTVKRAYSGAHGGVINAMVKKGMVTADNKTVSITEAGIDVLRGLPNFDMPVMGTPTAILPEDSDLLNMVAAEPVEAALDEVSARLVRVVMADGIGLEALVTHCGSEIMAMGGTVIKLELKEALLREIYPALTQYLGGLDAIGVEYSVFGDLQIVVERPINEDEPIPYELR